jgi:hypothetical protein
MERAIETEIVEVVEEEIYNSDVVENMKHENELTFEEVEKELGTEYRVT